MFKTLLAKVIGTRHQREQRRVQPIVDEINEFGTRLRDLSDAELQAQTPKFRATIAEATEALRGRIDALKAEKHAAPDAAAREAIDLQLAGADGQGGLEQEYREAIKEVLDEILPEAFATVREAVARLERDRPPSPDIARIEGLIRAGAFSG